MSNTKLSGGGISSKTPLNYFLPFPKFWTNSLAFSIKLTGAKCALFCKNLNDPNFLGKLLCTVPVPGTFTQKNHKESLEPFSEKLDRKTN